MSGVGELETEEKESCEPSERLHGVVGGETDGDEHQTLFCFYLQNLRTEIQSQHLQTSPQESDYVHYQRTEQIGEKLSKILIGGSSSWPLENVVPPKNVVPPENVVPLENVVPPKNVVPIDIF